MRRFLLTATLSLAFVFVTECAQAQGATLTFGAHGVYDIDWESFGIGGQARAGVNLGGFALLLNPSVEYFFLEDLDAGTTEFGQSLFRVGADLLYQIGTENVQVFQPYVGAGLGIQRYSTDADDIPGVDGSSTDLGLNLLAGANFGVGSPVVPFAQAGLLIGDGSYVTIKGGILFGGP